MKYDYYKHIKKDLLINDEKIKKAIKVWAEANEITEDNSLYFAKDEERGLSEIIDDFTGAKIRFHKIIPNLKQFEFYTINELCE